MSRSKANEIKTHMNRAENADNKQDEANAIEDALKAAGDAAGMSGKERSDFIAGWSGR